MFCSLCEAFKFPLDVAGSVRQEPTVPTFGIDVFVLTVILTSQVVAPLVIVPTEIPGVL